MKPVFSILMFIAIVVAMTGFLEWLTGIEDKSRSNAHWGFRLMACGVTAVALCAMELRS